MAAPENCLCQQAVAFLQRIRIITWMQFELNATDLATGRYTVQLVLKMQELGVVVVLLNTNLYMMNQVLL